MNELFINLLLANLGSLPSKSGPGLDTMEVPDRMERGCLLGLS